MLNMPSSIKELAPGERTYPQRICRELLCLNDNGIGCVRFRGVVCMPARLGAYPICMPDKLSMSSSIQ